MPDYYALIFAEDKITADLRHQELSEVAADLMLIDALHDREMFDIYCDDEVGAMILIDLKSGLKNVADYINSFGLDNRKITCLIPGDGEHSDVLTKLKINFIKCPVNHEDINVLLSKYSREIVAVAPELPHNPKIQLKIKKEKPRVILPGFLAVFRTEKGDIKFDLNRIKNIYRNVKTRKVYLVFHDNKEVRIMEIIKHAKGRLKIHGFELHHRGGLLNIGYITGFSRDNKIAHFDGESFK